MIMTYLGIFSRLFKDQMQAVWNSSEDICFHGLKFFYVKKLLTYQIEVYVLLLGNLKATWFATYDEDTGQPILA